jgi:hypothetical protein
MTILLSPEDAHREELLAQIDAAEAEIDRGEYVEYDADSILELAKDVHERGLQRMAVRYCHRETFPSPDEC